MKTFADTAIKSQGIVRRARLSTEPFCNPLCMSRLDVRQILRGTKVQPKLAVGSPNDVFEKEADHIADQVMRMPEPSAVEIPEEKEEKLVSLKADGGGEVPLSGELDDRVRSLEGGGAPLGEGERSFFESRFGVDFSQVRVHTGAAAEETARALNAQAFTLGRDVVFGAGRYSPGTDEGMRLMAHELTHVVQQNGGDVEGEAIQRAVDFTANFSGISLTPNPEYHSGMTTRIICRVFADGRHGGWRFSAAELDHGTWGYCRTWSSTGRGISGGGTMPTAGVAREQKFRPINTASGPVDGAAQSGRLTTNTRS